ncbi:hypothetical protein QTJ16_003131 [Diplocarpon rosae]|uniref:FAD-binding PCMH-type domain-containing protein n=1 Tax=Diplocarpon rosae TaxID=946125 RepID=A0AAD9WDA1_9HELO|nr:hypothetical protein QTJ16_003131 [Diplocarpon rosae]PBP27684.1 hypothetical protein BUE80_DR001303 [Diplocarpon rosae]
MYIVTALRDWKLLFGLVAATLLHSAAAKDAARDPVTQAHVLQVMASSNNSVGAACCNLLQTWLGSVVSTPNSTVYQQSTLSYWSAEAQSVDPGCVVSPTTTSDVSRAVGSINTLRELGIECKFAVRSGGHTPWAGAATISNGVQIDMSAIKQVTVDYDKMTTSIGPGARWLDVYAKLDALNLTVSGGRASTVGVGGLVTGGGISFFSAQRGFVADDVHEFEVVLYDGSVVNASSACEPDLFFALKGGSNNFGIVTRIDLATFSHGKAWGGTIFYPISAQNLTLPAFVKFAGQEDYDVYGALILTFSFLAPAPTWVITSSVAYTKPIVDPPVFRDFMAIQPQMNTTRITNFTDLTNEIASFTIGTKSQLFYTSTWSNDLNTLAGIVSLNHQYAETVGGVAGLLWSFSLQPLPTATTTKSAKTGGNPLGLEESDENLVVGLVGATWDNEADHAAVLAAVSGFFAAADEFAGSRHHLSSFKYLNYAYKTQEPIKGYGSKNVAKLRRVSKKYDPTGMFQKLVPGGWKLH